MNLYRVFILRVYWASHTSISEQIERSFILRSHEQWVSLCYAIESDRSFSCALFCVFMTRVGQCPISLLAEHPLQLHDWTLSGWYRKKHISISTGDWVEEALWLGWRPSQALVMLRNCNQADLPQVVPDTGTRISLWFLCTLTASRAERWSTPYVVTQHFEIK
jgi:hypothetical protein